MLSKLIYTLIFIAVVSTGGTHSMQGESKEYDSYGLDWQDALIFNVLIYKLLHVSGLTGPSSGSAVVQSNR
jgi:hypothetical protein